MVGHTTMGIFCAKTVPTREFFEDSLADRKEYVHCVGDLSNSSLLLAIDMSTSILARALKYVGVTQYSLYARMNGYRNPGPSQETNKRINPKIAQASKVQIYFLLESEIVKFATIVRGDRVEKQIPTDVNTFERFLISMFKPEWN